jgi:hypothetical protein
VFDFQQQFEELEPEAEVAWIEPEQIDAFVTVAVRSLVFLQKCNNRLGLGE